MKKLLYIFSGFIMGMALIASAQVSNVSQPLFFRYIGTSIVPINASSTIGTSTRAVANGFFTNLTVTSTTTLTGNVSLSGAIVPKTVNYTASTSVTINSDTTDIATIIVANATTTFQNPTGQLFNGKKFEVMLTATTTRGLAWASSTSGFASSTGLTLPLTTASGTARYIFEYRTQAGKWELDRLVTYYTN